MHTLTPCSPNYDPMTMVMDNIETNHGYVVPHRNPLNIIFLQKIAVQCIYLHPRSLIMTLCPWSQRTLQPTAVMMYPIINPQIQIFSKKFQAGSYIYILDP